MRELIAIQSTENQSYLGAKEMVMRTEMMTGRPFSPET